MFIAYLSFRQSHIGEVTASMLMKQWSQMLILFYGCRTVCLYLFGLHSLITFQWELTCCTDQVSTTIKSTYISTFVAQVQSNCVKCPSSFVTVALPWSVHF